MSILLLPDQGDRDPYWCRLWPSAVALAQLMLQQPELIRGKRVCEIGSGLGLAGIAAALAGGNTMAIFSLPHSAAASSLLSFFCDYRAVKPSLSIILAVAQFITVCSAGPLHSCNTAKTERMSCIHSGKLKVAHLAVKAWRIHQMQGMVTLAVATPYVSLWYRIGC